MGSEETILKDALGSERPLGPHDLVHTVKNPRGSAIVRVVDTELVEGKFEPYIENFKQNPVVELCDDGKNFILREDLNFYWWFYTTRTIVHEYMPTVYRMSSDVMKEVYVNITIKSGFVTDFVSSPPLLWSLVSPLGPAAKPSVLHDFFYRVPFKIMLPHHQSKSEGYRERRTWTNNQKDVDELFYDSLRLRSISKWKAKAMWAGLRLLGHRTYNKYR